MAATRPFLDQRGDACLLGRAEVEATVSESQRDLAREVELYFEEFRGAVYIYVFSLCRNPEYAEELTQDTFLRLYAYLRAGNRIENVRGWVFRVAHNLTVNQGKRRRFEVPGGLALEQWHHHSDPAHDPEQLLLDDERSSRFRQGLGYLTEHQRQCMQLRAEGFQTQQIAEILHISRGGVIDALQRAVKRLRKALQ
jgi:RNA polymerase sigma-70 factor, ECF subfamily